MARRPTSTVGAVSNSAELDVVDAVVVGAGFAGLYALHKFRSQGLSVRVFEAAPEVGGTWYFNRYPGARCDVESVDYCFSFSEELQQEWTWTEKYATQAEILRYMNWVADRLDLRGGITFNTRVTSATLDEQSLRWTVVTDTGETVTARFVVMATGPLSAALTPAFPGLDTFAGEVYHTAHWPHEPVDFTGKRVAVIGTGSSGIQSIPLIAEQAEHLYVFQRTPNFSVPAGNRPLTAEEVAEIKANYAERRRLSWRSGGGSPHIAHPKLTMEVSAEERRAAFERRWDLGGVLFSKTFSDQMIDEAANEEARKFYEEKVRAVIDDPALADLLIPNDHPIGTKRICTDTNYFQTFNRPNVTLVSVRNTPIESIDPTGIATSDTHYDIDALVLATGFDAMTGALDKIDIVGRDGRRLREDWADGPRTYLGLGVDGFPNLFLVSGPGAPAVLANMVLHAEAHIDWIADAIGFLDDHGYAALEATPESVDNWIAECNQRAEATLFPKANSWYMGANVPGKPRVFMLFIGGFAAYLDICAEVAAAGYKGFSLLKGA
ncbi:flavin-containing monooxygenase [Mycolicibacterium parafortuitum]|uniref:Monooxygenase [Rhodococcus jostii RHA1] n=1 Tax=Mycolicibacterium parafortuitum TaxID=39692 RepID=A0A375YI82_MYCPF|nr:NAD(P)/FAD-dependent oxidoreductase [Mycolicibacterium parafortuitum]ORB24998.1 cyclohexanone monooxygenase [Mycolicibacterium parafortuitum]SRX80793.1 monooxygenase [Rhodococcus jostii RHA1] [Mycolicibacterium parafortuitum]